MSKPERQNCIEIIRPYVDAVTAEGMPAVQFFGGVGSVALGHPDTVIDLASGRTSAPGTLELDNYRHPTKRRNKRDVETLVLSSDPRDTERVNEYAKQTIGNRLIIETFDMHDVASITRLVEHPFGLRSLVSALSDRYIDGTKAWDPGDNDAERILYPFAVDIDPKAMASSMLEIGDKLEMPTPKEGAVILNYLTRSISGLRGKDHEKVQTMARMIFSKAPETVDWIIDGPGASQFELARILHTLREPVDNPQTLVLGDKLVIDILNEDLTEHPAFLYKDADSDLKQKVMRLAKLKSRVIHTVERNELFVQNWQQYVEPRIKSILHNR
jgi:hypothetical protein